MIANTFFFFFRESYFVFIFLERPLAVFINHPGTKHMQLLTRSYSIVQTTEPDVISSCMHTLGKNDGTFTAQVVCNIGGAHTLVICLLSAFGREHPSIYWTYITRTALQSFFAYIRALVRNIIMPLRTIYSTGGYFPVNSVSVCLVSRRGHRTVLIIHERLNNYLTPHFE